MSLLATYRLQMRAGFDFDDAAELADYLETLGVSHVYLSPILQAVRGSSHGYDVVDPRVIDPDLGGAGGYTRMTSALRQRGLGQLLDIVPNHMATDPDNPWWWDVLTNGPSSRYASFFDIDWEGPGEASWSKVLVPVLGDHYGRVLEAGEFGLARQGSRFEVMYRERRLPVAPESMSSVLLSAARRSGRPELAEAAEELGRLPSTRGDSAARLERHQVNEQITERLEDLLADPTIAEAIDEEIVGVSTDIDRLDELLDEQHYRLAHWRIANEEIDYRRFFSIETLVGVRADDPEVLSETHRLVFDLVRDQSVDALRIDHIDGIARPAHYLEQLEQSTGGAYVVVEKILEAGEELPDNWPVSGTTGYDFLNRVNSVFVDSAAEERMTHIYEGFTGAAPSYADVLRDAKRQVLDTSFAAEIQRLTGMLAQVCSQRRRHRDHTRRELRDTLAEVVVAFPVYRLYVAPGSEPSSADVEHAAAAIAEARRREPDLDVELLELVTDLSLGRIPGHIESAFARLFQQLTAPVMAKGAEDTAFYRYNRLLSLNEVGGDPGLFGIDTATFHRLTEQKAREWPETMLTIGTHDTKRSPDVRARLNVLSEIPGAWESALSEWRDLTERFEVGGLPDANTRYHFYQCLVGAWPIDAERMRQYMAKAIREAKAHTSWIDPDPDYEAAVEKFVTSSLADDDFVASLETFIETNGLVERGRSNSLRQVALLLTCPGVPDVYQGSELWDSSLVDPDNRRPVDYGLRRKVLSGVDSSSWIHAGDSSGAAKILLTQRLLQFRRDQGLPGGYEPLQVGGARSSEILAYLSGHLAAVIPVRSAGSWAGTVVQLPVGRWYDLMTGSEVEGGPTDVAGLLGPASLAVLSDVSG